MEPTDGMTAYQATHRVLAGEITEVVAAGCFVRTADGGSMLRVYEPNMIARRTPVIGDIWAIWDTGYQSIVPRAAFAAGYHEIGPQR